MFAYSGSVVNDIKIKITFEHFYKCFLRWLIEHVYFWLVGPVWVTDLTIWPAAGRSFWQYGQIQACIYRWPDWLERSGMTVEPTILPCPLTAHFYINVHSVTTWCARYIHYFWVLIACIRVTVIFDFGNFLCFSSTRYGVRSQYYLIFLPHSSEMLYIIVYFSL